MEISGISSLYTTNYVDKNYIFIGDRHYNIYECEDCVPETCIHIIDLLEKIFNYGNIVDFYLEIPFLGKTGFLSTLEETYKNTKFGMLYKTYYKFYDCINKLKCDFNNVRFHYIDIRLGYLVRNDLTTYQIFFQYIEAQLLDKCLYILEKIESNVKYEGSDFVDDSLKLIDDFYYNEKFGNKKYQQIFNIYLKSNDFINDLEKFLANLPKFKDKFFINEIRRRTFNKNISVTRRSKTMSRIRAQLEALEYEGKNDIKDKIEEFVSDGFRKELDTDMYKDAWQSLKILNNGMIEHRYSYENIQKIIKNIRAQEYHNTLRGGAYLVDAYTLARSFRTFLPESNKKFFYTGYKHSIRYVEFFEKYLNCKIKKYYGEGCIDVSVNEYLKITS
jgi:hypothetical protein